MGQDAEELFERVMLLTLCGSALLVGWLLGRLLG